MLLKNRKQKMCITLDFVQIVCIRELYAFWMEIDLVKKGIESIRDKNDKKIFG